MKNTVLFSLVVSLTVASLPAYAQAPTAPPAGVPEQAAPAVPVNLSPAAAEVLRLATSGVGDDVVLAYIQNSQAPFNLTADNVLYLKDQGLSSQVTSAMLSRDTALRGQTQQYAPAPVAPAAPPPAAPAAPAPAVQPAAPAAPVAVAAPAPTYVTSPPADVTYFYNDLSPYGTWVYLEGYGWCWQPRAVVISPAWRPYCDGGYWVYTDAGWYWQSTYSWGWAPFHYGRWYAHPRCGWVWMPDRVWGPAWVTWRVAGDSCGWAPLPPHADFDVRMGWRFNGVAVGASFDFGLGVGAFTFVGFGDFCSHDLHHSCYPPARVNNVYHQTTIVNNYVVNNNTIVNRGVPIERVSAGSRSPVPRATVHDAPAGGARFADRSGSVVYRHPLQAPARPANMVAQKVDNQHPVVQHAPITTVGSARPAGYTSKAPAPTSAPGRSAVRSPKVSPWSSSSKPASSSEFQTPQKTYQPRGNAPGGQTQRSSSFAGGSQVAATSQSQLAPRASQPASTTLSTATTPRAPEVWKQGTRVAPGYRSDVGLAARFNAREAGQPATKTELTSSQKGYQPKGYHQAAEVRTLSPSDDHASGSPSSSAKSSASRSGKKGR